MRYNLKFRKLTFYGLTRPQSIRKSKQISGQTILSSPQDAEFNPNFAKNRDIPVVKNSVTRPVTPVLPIEPCSKLNLLVNLLSSLIVAFSSDTTYSVPGITSHTFMFSFRLAISLKKWYINRKNLKTKAVYSMIFSIAGYLRTKSSQTMPFGL